MIISPAPININTNVPQILVNPFLSEKDIRNLFGCIDDIKVNRTKNKMKEKILYFFREDLFFINQPFKTSTDVIETICDKMIAHHYVCASYKDEIYEHEKISPSSYSNIAIPHPLNTQAHTTNIAVSINPEPIAWGMNQVNIVFMLSIKEEDRDVFSDVFDFITKIIMDEATFKKIMKIESFDDFINLIIASC